MYVILCQLASLCHIMSFCTPRIHSHQSVCRLHQSLGYHDLAYIQWMQINLNLGKTTGKIHYFSKMRPKAKNTVFLLVISHHRPVSASRLGTKFEEVSYGSLNSLYHNFWSQKSILWSTWPYINHSTLKRVCKLNLNTKKKSLKWRQFIT